LVIAVAALCTLTASAQQAPDPPICNTNLREWGRLAGSSDDVAMRDLLARTPNACRELRGQITARIAALRPPAAPAPRPTATTSRPPRPTQTTPIPAANPCAGADAAWASLLNSTDMARLEAFVRDTLASCDVRAQAATRIATLRQRDAAAGLTAGQGFDDCFAADWCPSMVIIPAGTYMIGPSGQRRITISAFAVGKYEITFAQWDACVAQRGCHELHDQGWGRGNRPAVGVTWNDAHAYVVWLSRATGRRYRLLSEAEWEYAARAGTNTLFPWGASASHEYANYGDGRNNGLVSGRDQWVNTSPVGSFPPNGFGLYDMHGNVWEWLEDCFAGAFDSVSMLPTNGSAYVAPNCVYRSSRGGSWLDDGNALSLNSRRSNQPTYFGPHFGLRVARTLN
jgi:formylglycine-generating enzyme required for sulfatase activity